MSTSSKATEPNPLPREREAKFTLTQSAAAAAAAHHLAQQGVDLRDSKTVTHIDTYLDTPGFDLYRRGLSLRLRRQGDQRELGLKQTGTSTTGRAQDRIDFSTPLSPDQPLHNPSAWPKPMVQQLIPLLDKLGDLRPQAELRQIRQKQIMAAAPQAPPTAEWSLDRVAVYAPTDEAPAKDKESAASPAAGTDAPPLAVFDELEMELLDATADEHFDAWVKAVAAVQGVRVARGSKFTRAIQVVLRQPTQPDASKPLDEALRAQPLAEACRAILAEQMTIILQHEAGVRAGNDPEAVHASRVAIRRARAAFYLFGHTFRPKVQRRYKRGLKRLGRALGPVRDLDVALANLETFRKQMDKDDRPQLRPLRKALLAQREVAQAALLKRLEGDDHHAFMEAFIAFCTTPGRGVLPAADNSEKILPHQVRHTMPSIIWRCFEQVRAYETALTDAEPPPLPTFHALRIQAKYLRYSLEFAAPMLGEQGKMLVAQLKALQDHLGALNDAYVEQKRLAAWATDLPDSEILTLRMATLATMQQELVATAPAKLAKVTHHDSRQLLAAALANI